MVLYETKISGQCDKAFNMTQTQSSTHTAETKIPGQCDQAFNMTQTLSSTHTAETQISGQCDEALNTTHTHDYQFIQLKHKYQSSVMRP